MNSNVKFIFGMIVGAAVGVFSTKKYFAKKEQKRADEEIASVKERFTVPRENKEEKMSDMSPEEKKNIPEEKTEKKFNSKLELLEDIIKSFGIGDVLDCLATGDLDSKKTEQLVKAAKAMKNYRGEATVDESKPFLISPDDFEENELDYEHQNLTYYADGIVTDDQDHVLDYPEDILGGEFENWFGEYEPDCIHVRNKEKEVDYEVLKDVRRFRDVLNDRPRPVSIK